LTGGQFKGRRISTPTGCDMPVKPTLSKVRESVFNILNSYFMALDDEDTAGNAFSRLSFLDMFTGSGIMALEAYSRGFRKVYAIEKQPSVFCGVKKIYKEFGADIILLRGDCLKIAEKIDEKFDVIYIDPPWDFDYAPAVTAALACLKKEGIIITECNKKGANQSYQYLGTKVLPFREKIYGRCKLDFFKLP